MYNHGGELGSSICYTDIQLPRFFKGVKPIWEMLGFDEFIEEDTEIIDDEIIDEPTDDEIVEEEPIEEEEEEQTDNNPFN